MGFIIAIATLEEKDYCEGHKYKKKKRVVGNMKVRFKLSRDNNEDFPEVYVKVLKRDDDDLDPDEILPFGFFELIPPKDLDTTVTFKGELIANGEDVEFGEKFFEIYSDAGFTNLIAQSWKQKDGKYIIANSEVKFELVEACP
ncbi:hypothetical protein [Roseibium sp. MMSF_3544]|uniref:hypothetical protein n=1 Tax=unclassified Roseibium TaxID=2629323 RepID=UPI00273FA24E|nr:hypothetical protein [Roseibium sp. MMSF_3544]